jgi:hypothetical protein
MTKEMMMRMMSGPRSDGMVITPPLAGRGLAVIPWGGR